jgi:cytochrome P450
MALFIGSARETEGKYARAEAATREMAQLFRELIAARRTAPRLDMLSELVHLEDAGERFSEDELVATCILLLFAGHETTTHHLANGLLALLRFPGTRRSCAPRRTRRRSVEELLRYDGPIGAQVHRQEPQRHEALRQGERAIPR